MSDPRSLALGAALAFTAACGNQSPFEPTDLGQLRFSEPITLGDLSGQLVTGPARAEIKLLDNGLVAREVELESSDELSDEEKLEFVIVSIDDAAGTLVLDFADLSVQYNGATSFENFNGDNMSRADFVAFVQKELADGRRVGVEAKRPAQAEPQAPDDETFLATKLELDDVDDRKVRMNIDSDNLTVNEPDAVIQVLGRQIELRISDGTTKLEREDEDLDGEIKFKDFVQSTGDGFFTLANGTIVRIVEGVTQIDAGDNGKRLGSLAEVQAALDAQMSVRAKGEAIEDPDNAGTLIAVEVRFKVKREDKRITLQDLAARLSTTPVRAEMELRNGGVVIRELEVESDDDNEENEEEIKAHIESVDGAGSVTVDIAGLVLSFDANTRFKDFDGDEITQTQFVTLVDAEITAGRTPRVKAKRQSPGTPQAPDDVVFVATRMELDDDMDERKIEITIDGANLVINDPRPDGGPDATVQVLGVTLEIRVTEGLTQLELEGY